MPNDDLLALCARSAPRLRALLLDAGNTLIFPDWARIAAWCAEAGAPLSVERLQQANTAATEALDRFMRRQAPRPPRGLLGTALEAAGLAPEVCETVLARIEGLDREGRLWRVVRPGTVEALRALRSLGLVLGVVSNADGRVERFLVDAGLREHLDFVLDSALVGVEKPDPAIFHLALERAGASPDQALHVGDICSIDVAGARAAGIEAVLLDPVEHYRGCDAPRIRHLDELAHALTLARRARAG